MYHKKYEKHTNSNTKKKRFNLYLHIFCFTNKVKSAFLKLLYYYSEPIWYTMKAIIQATAVL